MFLSSQTNCCMTHAQVGVTVVSGWPLGHGLPHVPRVQTGADPRIFGTWNLTDGVGTAHVTAAVNSNVTSQVIAVNEQRQWEQELSTFVLDVAPGGFVEIR